MATLPTVERSRWPWAMLVARTLLFLFWQAIIAGILALTGHPSAWRASAGWWPITATLGSLVMLAVLSWLYRREGRRYRDLWRFDRAHMRQDLWLLLAFLALSGPVAMGPNILLAKWLFTPPETAMSLFIQPLPLWAGVAALTIFPLTIALTELPTYLDYAMPRLVRQTGRPWLAVALAAFWLSTQHVTLPFVAHGPFILWRLLMYLPFALMLAILLHRRPWMLPYLMIVHWLMDMATAAMVFMAAL